VVALTWKKVSFFSFIANERDFAISSAFAMVLLRALLDKGLRVASGSTAVFLIAISSRISGCLVAFPNIAD
jgi:hypothetical protein